MKNLYLHIGLPKTGTTSLQFFLSKNKTTLEEGGIGFFVLNSFDQPRYRYANAAFIRALLQSENNDMPTSTKESSYEALDFLALYARDYNTLILSEELLWTYAKWGSKGWKKVLGLLSESLGPDWIIRPVVYLRRQDIWVLSWWKEVVHMNTPERRGFLDFFESLERDGILDYHARLSDIEALFGKGSVIVREYDRSSFPDGMIERDFLPALGIPWNNDFVTHKTTINPSITIAAASASPFVKVEMENPRGVVRLFSNMFPQRSSYYPMEYNERKSILEKYHEGNEAISDRYLNGRRLFNYEIDPYEVWRPDPERDKQNAEYILKLAKSRPEVQNWMFRYLQEKR